LSRDECGKFAELLAAHFPQINEDLQTSESEVVSTLRLLHRDLSNQANTPDSNRAEAFDLVIEFDDQETQGEQSASCSCRLERTESSVGLIYCDLHRVATDVETAKAVEVMRIKITVQDG